MNNEFLKYVGFGLLGLYVYQNIKGKGTSPALNGLIKKSESFVDGLAENIPDPDLRTFVSHAGKRAARNHLMNHANIRDVTPLEGGQ